MSKERKDQEVKGLSRRDFLKNAGLLVGSAAVGTAVLGMPPEKAEAATSEPEWDYAADVVIIGGGGSGLVAACRAQAEGSTVLIVEANWDVGGHAAVCAGQLHLGGGTSVQKKYGIADSPDQYYIDHTNPINTTSRFDDPVYVRAIADNIAETYEFIAARGVKVKEEKPTIMSSQSKTDTLPRSMNTDAADWVSYLTGEDGNASSGRGSGIGITRPLEKYARTHGVRFLMNYHMDELVKINGRVVGLEASYKPHYLPGESEPMKNLMPQGNIEASKETVSIKARKGVIIATGGWTGNVNMRTMFEPRFKMEHDGLGGMPFSDQDGSGEIAAMEIGASLGALANYPGFDSGMHLSQPTYIGTQYGYQSTAWKEKSPIFPLVRATGLTVAGYDGIILVNMLGKRFWSEDAANNMDYFSTSMSSVLMDGPYGGDAYRLGGPVWAIFDAKQAESRKWELKAPYVDIAGGRFFSGATIEELAQKIINLYYEQIKMEPAVLAETVKKFNSYVDAGKDAEFGRTTLKAKISQGPFYAAWATPVPHDCNTGLRVDGNMKVIDIHGNPISGLYASGESSAGMRLHGLGRVLPSGYIAGLSAAHGV